MVWQYILYFFLYAALGWAAEVCFAAWKEHRLVNRGFLNGPLCPVYGFGMAAMLLLLAPWQGNVLAVFAGGMAITTLIEWLAGWLLYKLFRARWWDYSHLPFNIGGFVCLPFSLLWGAASVVMLLAVHPPIARLAGPSRRACCGRWTLCCCACWPRTRRGRLRRPLGCSGACASWRKCAPPCAVPATS